MNKLIWILLIFFSACGKDIVYQPFEQDGVKYAYIQCKSTSATAPTICTLTGHDEIAELISVEAMDANTCVLDLDVGINSRNQVWSKDLCNGWIKFKLR